MSSTNAQSEAEASSEPFGVRASSDYELIELFRSGDPAGFDELFRRYQASVRAVCLRLLGEVESSADDMVQETFIKLLRSLDGIDETFNVAGWVQRVAVNTCKDELRRRQKRIQRRVDSRDDDEDALLRLPDPATTSMPEDAYEFQRLRELIWEVSKRLPPRQRTALAMRELQGLSYGAIAKFMRTSESAVETLLHRARKRFRDEFYKLEGPVEEDGPCLIVARLLATDRPLSSEEEELVSDHIRVCSWCRERDAVRS